MMRNFFVRVLKVTDVLLAVDGPKMQLLRREQKDGAGIGGWETAVIVEIPRSRRP